MVDLLPARGGSAGKDTRGIIRVHQFQKLEMFSYIDPADAEAEHERLLALQEGMLQSLGLSYRVIDTAAGDLGSSAARKYDVEAWVPTQGAYRELTSTSNCTTYQARRLDIRYRTESGKTAPVATLNGTLATTRWIVAILETHQQADGSVVVPEALRPLPRARGAGRPCHDRRAHARRAAGSIALDIDGTVLREDGSLGDDDARARCAGCAALGHEVMLATGRSVSMTLPVARSARASTSRTSCARTGRSCSGATRRRRSATRARSSRPSIPREVLTTIRGHLEGASYAVEDADGVFRYHRHLSRGRARGDPARRSSSTSCCDVQATRVVVISPEHAIEDFLAVVEQMGLHKVSYNVGWTAWLDIAPDGVNKATGLERVREQLGISRDPRARDRRRTQRHRHARMGRRGRRVGVAMGQAPDEVAGCRERAHGHRSRRRRGRRARTALPGLSGPHRLHSAFGQPEGCPSGRWSQS